MPFRHGIHISNEQSSKIIEYKKYIKKILYALAIGSLMYVMLYTRSNIYHTIGVISHYQSNLREEH